MLKTASDGLPMHLQALVQARRPDSGIVYRERAHLLLLYEDLAACITSRESRVRTAVQDLLLMAGEELGLAKTAWSPRVALMP